jgi:hypothetical protein
VAVREYLGIYTRTEPYPGFAFALLRKHFRRVRFSPDWKDEVRQDFVNGARPQSFREFQDYLSDLWLLLVYERDEINNRIVQANASGFSHGFWLFR